MIRIKARGLDGFQHNLDVSEERLTDGMRTLETDLAKETAQRAHSKAEQDKKTGRAADTITFAGPVASGGGGIEYYGFYDFGGKVGPDRRIHRPYKKTGRFLFVAVKEIGVVHEAEQVAEKATKELQ